MPPVAEETRPRRRNRRERSGYTYDQFRAEIEAEGNGASNGDYTYSSFIDEIKAESEPTEDPEEESGGFLRNLGAVPGGVLRGAAGLVASVPEVAAEATTLTPGESHEDSALFRAGTGIREWAEDVAPPVPGAKWGNMIGEGIGSAVGAVGAGAAAALAAPVGAGVAVGTGVAAGVGLAAGAASGFREARAAGADVGDARIASAAMGLIGTTEALPVGRFLGAIGGRFARGVVGEAVVEAVEEMAQEGFQTLTGNQVAQWLFDRNRGAFDGLLESVAVGGLVGGGLGAVGGAVGQYREGKAAALAEAGLGAPEAVVGRGTVGVAGEAAPPVEVPVAGKEAALVEAGVRPRPSQQDLGSYAGKGEFIGNTAPGAATEPLVAADDPNAEPEPPAPESPIGRVAAETREFGTAEAMRLEKSLGMMMPGAKVEKTDREFRVTYPSGRTLHIVGTNEIRPEAIPGGPEMLQRELDQNRGLRVDGAELQAGAPRGLFLPDPASIRLRTDDGQEFTANDVIVLASTADATTTNWELYRSARANLFNTAERRLMRREFPTEEAEAAAYVELVNGRLDHPLLSRIREFFQRLAEFFGAGQKQGAAGRALMRDLAGGRLGTPRKGTLAAEGPGFMRDEPEPAPGGMGIMAGRRASPEEAAVGADALAAAGANTPEAKRAARVREAAAQRVAEAERAKRELTVPPLGAESAQPAGGLAPTEGFDEEAGAPIPMGMPVPPRGPVTTKGGGTRESKVAPPRPPKRVSKLAKPTQGSLVEEPLKFKRTRRDPNAPPESWGDVVRKIANQSNKIGLSREVAGELHHAGFFDEFGPDSKFVKSSKRGLAMMAGEASRYFYITNPTVSTFGGPRRGGRSGKNLASGHSAIRVFIPYLEAVGARGADGELIGDHSDMPDILAALLSTSPKVPNFDALVESPGYEMHAYDDAVSEGFDGTLEEWRQSLADAPMPVREEPEGMPFQPAKREKDVFSARQVSVPEMPKGPRPVVQKMFGLDLQPPAMQTGENPEADPDTPDMFTGETGAKKPAKAKPKGRAPGGQGSFGFQPAAKGEEQIARETVIKSYLETAYPNAYVNRPREFYMDMEAERIFRTEQTGSPFHRSGAVYGLAEIIRSESGETDDLNNYTDAAADVLEEAFDISREWALEEGVFPHWSSHNAAGFAGDGRVHLKFGVKRGDIEAKNFVATVEAVPPADFGAENIIAAHDVRTGKPMPVDEELVDEIGRLYKRAAVESPVIEGAIAAHIGSPNVAFQPGKDERVPPLVTRNVPQAKAVYDWQKKMTDREVRADADVLAEAKTMAADPAAVAAMLSSAAKAKRSLTDAETVAAEMVGRALSARAFVAGIGSEAEAQAFDFWEDFLTIRSEAGRTLRAGQIITNKLLSEADKVRAAIARIAFGPGADGRMVPSKMRAKYIAEAKAEAAAQGIDLESFMTSNAAVEAMDAARDRFDALLREAGAEFNTSSGRDFRVRKTINEAKKAADQIRADLIAAAGNPGMVKKVEAAGRALLKALFKGKFGFQPAAGAIDALFASSAELSKASIANRKTGAKLARIFQAKRATGWDALHEFWISGILSGPQTHLVNFASNTLEQVFSAGMRVPQAILADMARLLRVHDKGGPSIGELPEFYKGLIPGIQLGYKNMLETFESEMPVLSSSDFVRPFAISGKKGKAIRTFVRALSAADQFFKGIAWRMQVGAEAWRAGRKKGLRGLDLRAFIDDQIAKPDPEILVDALAYADETTFNQDAGPLAEAAAFVRRKLHLRYQLPFINIAVNLLQTGVRRTPLGTAKVAAGLVKEAIAKRAGGEFRYEDKFRDIAEQFVAWGALVALAGAMGDDDDPRITGTKLYGVDKKGDIELAYRAAPPQSIKIGDRWYSYARLDPFASSLALMVDGLRTMRAGGKDAMEKAIRSAVGLVTDKTFLDQLGDLFEVATEPSAKNVGQFASKFATSWVPNIIRQPARGFEPNILETKDQPLGARMKRDAFPALRGPFVPKVDLWGREIDASPSPKTDLLYRILSPSRAQRAEEGTELALDRTIMRHNALFPDSAWAPESPVSKFDRGGVPYQMTPGEYNTFMRIAGGRTVRALRGLAARPLPKDDDARGWSARIGAMKDAIERERSVAKDIFVRARRSGRPYQAPEIPR